MDVNGLLLVDKPKDWTSFDVVAKVRGVLRSAARASGAKTRIKVGHTGTLDPMATGLLVLAIGSYTKKVPELTKKDKSYEAVITLGSSSNTDDAEGELQFVSNMQPTPEEVQHAVESYIGTISQVPPQFSAIKVGGVRSYNAARKGDVVALQPRTVQIHSISQLSYTYPTISCVFHVGSGTYIRSIARDIGNDLHTGAYLSGLRRTSVGDFTLAKAVRPESLSSDDILANIVA